MALRLGDVLVQLGVITEPIREQILQEQRASGRPFGVIAEVEFGVDPELIEQAWARQYESLAGSADPAAFELDPRVTGVITARQAWQFKVLPLCRRQGELMLCTPRENLPRALRFAARQIAECCFFVIAEPEAMARAMQRAYPMPGLGADTLRQPAPKLAGRAV
jgi:hypothetical protein